MDRHLHKILCENDLAEHQVIVALTSRDICSVADFLERGEDALKDMRDKLAESGKFWDTKQHRDDAFAEFKLITPVQNSKLRKVLETLRDTKK